MDILIALASAAIGVWLVTFIVAVAIIVLIFSYIKKNRMYMDAVIPKKCSACRELSVRDRPDNRCEPWCKRINVWLLYRRNEPCK